MSGRSVHFVAPYCLSPGDLNPVFQVMCEYTKQREAACAWRISTEANKCIFGYVQMHRCLKNEFPRKGRLNIGVVACAGFWLETFRLCGV